MKVKEGQGESFEHAWREIAEEVGSFPGNVRQALLRDPEDPLAFVVTTDWESRDAFTRFERSPEQDDLTAPLRELRATAHMTVHDLIAEVG